MVEFTLLRSSSGNSENMENNAEEEELDTLTTRRGRTLDHQQHAEASVRDFFEVSGLGFLANDFKRAGFQSVADVLALTPRKYAAVGVDLQVGTKLRLSRL